MVCKRFNSIKKVTTNESLKTCILKKRFGIESQGVNMLLNTNLSIKSLFLSLTPTHKHIHTYVFIYACVCDYVFLKTDLFDQEMRPWQELPFRVSDELLTKWSKWSLDNFRNPTTGASLASYCHTQENPILGWDKVSPFYKGSTHHTQGPVIYITRINVCI